ncbi:hypothetical protein NQ318_009442 [Aromia moschata]|uniref:Transposase n=1 Tax=Aromia moschata TaxID=1265417 RepID=A0AAV8Z985_9CUCU|nr:hypothetical protein NQ318_009442 [Aromia moschata]
MVPNSEMTDMMAIYAQQIGTTTTYPNRRQPNRKLFSRLFSILREPGSSCILVVIIADLTTSRILHEQQLRAYHYSPTQILLPGDFLARMQFWEFILRRNRQDAYFVTKILFTDEATFTRRGIFNRKSCHIWADQNPNANWVRHFRHEFKINIWCGIIGDYLEGPFELPAKLNGQDYLNFLQENLVDLLEEVPLDVRANMWYLQDGAPAHFPFAVRNHLNTHNFLRKHNGTKDVVIKQERRSRNLADIANLR